MAWRDWIEPRDVSQESQLSPSQDSKTGRFDPKKVGSGEFATLTAATAATDRQTLIDRCREACKGLALDPGQLADWLIDQGDPDWLHPAPVHWWAQRISRHGYPEDRYGQAE